MEQCTPLDLVLTMMLACWRPSPRQLKGLTTTLTVQKRYIHTCNAIHVIATELWEYCVRFLCCRFLSLLLIVWAVFSVWWVRTWSSPLPVLMGAP